MDYDLQKIQALVSPGQTSRYKTIWYLTEASSLSEKAYSELIKLLARQIYTRVAR